MKSVTSMRIVSGFRAAPTGCCIHPLAIRIQSAERLLPSATSQVTARCARGDKPVPTEEEEADECRLEKERHQPFDRERGSEDISHVMGVVGPVHAELEFHGDAGRDTEREIDAEQQAPKLRHLAPNGPPGHDVDGLHHGDENGEAEREGDEQKVIHRRERELQSRKLDQQGIRHGSLPFRLRPVIPLSLGAI